MVTAKRGTVIDWSGLACDMMATDAFLRCQFKNYKPCGEDLAALQRHKLSPEAENLTVGLPLARQRMQIFNSLNSQTIATGGATVPQSFARGWIRGIIAASPMRQLATIADVDRGGNYVQPLVNDATGEGELMREGQTGTISTASDVSFGANVYRLVKYTSKGVKVASELELDVQNFAENLGQVLGERCGKIENRHFTLGSGVSQPLGAAIPSSVSGIGTQQVSAASATAISGDDLLGLVAAVGDAHADPATSVFVMHRDTKITLLKQKAGASGAYLFDPTYNTIFGYRVHVNYHMDSTIASGSRSVVFGNFTRFLIAEVPEVKLQRAEETYADLDQRLFRAVHRCDARLMNAGDNPLSVLVH